VPALEGGLVKSLACKKTASCPELLECSELPAADSTGIHAGRTSVLDLITNVLIRGTPGQKLVDIS